MGKIYLTRHGETELNIADRYQGFVDSPLTPRGVKQAEALGSALKDKHIDRVYTSDLSRAIITSEIIMKNRKYEHISRYDLREHNWGEWDGMIHKDVWDLFGAKDNAEFKKGNHYPKEGEDAKEFGDRIIPCFQKIADENKDNDILIVTHYCDVACIINYLKGLDYYEGYVKAGHIKQASLTLIDNTEDGLKLLMENDVSHLMEVGVDNN